MIFLKVPHSLGPTNYVVLFADITFPWLVWLPFSANKSAHIRNYFRYAIL